MTIKTEGVHAGEFLLSEANGTRSREEVVICAGTGKLSAGTVIAQITSANALTPTAAETNTGDGTLGSVTVTSAATSGHYSLAITGADGEFKVSDPQGAELGSGMVGDSFAGGGLTFTLRQGDVDFAVGDSFTLDVKANLGEYTAYSGEGTDDGRRTADGILFAPVDATSTDQRAVGVMRDAEVIARLLTGLDDAARADLLNKGLIVRP